jgi:hypothetical protein
MSVKSRVRTTPVAVWTIRRSSTRYPASSMSPQCLPRLLMTCCVFTLCVVRKRSAIIWSTVQRELNKRQDLYMSVSGMKNWLIYYESINRELKTRPTTDECRCDERQKTIAEESTHLAYTGFLGELEHLKIETRLIDEMFASVKGEYVFLKSSCLLWINKARVKDKTYIWLSARWKTKTKTKKITCLTYTGLVVELKHLKIKTRLTNEKFASVKGECEI